jgi:hypothetical protein
MGARAARVSARVPARDPTDANAHVPDGSWRHYQVTKMLKMNETCDRCGRAVRVANLPSSAVSHPAVPVLLFDSLGVYRMLSSVTDPAGSKLS